MPDVNMPSKNSISEVFLSVTTLCNMRCPNCFLQIPRRSNRRHVELSELIEIAKKLRGIERIRITGGEPTLHPKFSILADHIKHAAKVEHISVTTNAHVIPEAGFDSFDRVYVTQYERGCYPGYPGNGDNVRKLKSQYPDKVIVASETESYHIPKEGGKHRGTFPCYRYTQGSVLVFDGELYPCVCPPVPLESKGFGLPIEEGWQWDIMMVEPPCERCRFAE